MSTTSASQIYRGDAIKTTIDDAKMKALYQAVEQNETHTVMDGWGAVV